MVRLAFSELDDAGPRERLRHVPQAEEARRVESVLSLPRRDSLRRDSKFAPGFGECLDLCNRLRKL